jgi:hypothetical protein
MSRGAAMTAVARVRENVEPVAHETVDRIVTGAATVVPVATS